MTSSTLDEEATEKSKVDSSDNIVRKYGMVLFDDEKAPTDGWISVNGSTARRIQGMHQLSTDTLWWSNITYQSFFQLTKTSNNPWLRHDAYLVLKPKDVLMEWGHDPAIADPDMFTNFCSTMFQRIMTMSWNLVRECNPKANFAQVFSGKSLRDDLRCLLPPAEYPKNESPEIFKSGQGYVDYTSTMVRTVRGGKTIVLRRPRIAYTTEILTTPIPKGKFEHRSKASIREHVDRVAWIRQNSQPCMVEIAVSSMDPDVSGVYAFGSSMDQNKRTQRSWVAHPEFLVMSSFSNIDVRQAWLGERYGVLSNELAPPLKAFLSNRHVNNSWSAGIVAETIWRAASLPEEKTFKNKNVPVEDRPQTSWRGLWLKAADKTQMFLSAMSLSDLGHAVVSYGIGGVQCSVTEEQIPTLMQDALTVGLVPRLIDIPPGLFMPESRLQWGGDKNSMALVQLTMTKQVHMLWNLDKIPLYDVDKQDLAIRKLIEAKNQGKLG